MILFISYISLKPIPMEAEWQEHLQRASTAYFDGDLVTIMDVRNFRYYPTEEDMHPSYYDKTYDSSQISRVWYTTEPFNENKLAAHTYVSFEFNNGDFLAISIEARKTKDQKYSIWKGMINTYPLIYIAADERDVTLLRANIRKDQVYTYPIKLSDPDNAKKLFINMTKRMNSLTTDSPEWYNTIYTNCTSQIAKEVNEVVPGRLPMFSWQLWLTASADEFALDNGLLDTNLPIEESRRKYLINDISNAVGDVGDYSKLIRSQK